MYTSFQLAKKYIHYRLKAANSKGHGMHSPFVFHFILDVLNNRQQYFAPAQIEEARKQLKRDEVSLQVEDLGAGSRTGATKTRTVGEIARSALKPKKYSQLLYRLVKKYQPETIIELGTSLGITTAYLATAAPGATIYTIEGSAAIQQQAVQTFQNLGLQNIQSLTSNFDEALPNLLSRLTVIDLCYIDGNHRYEPTVRYFHQLLSKVSNNSMLIFDDIHWSREMEQAWEEIKAHSQVQCTIDIFFLGFVFFRSEFKEKQHFSVRY